MFLRKHWLAVACAILVGVIYIAPQIFFIVSLGREYQGIPMLQTPNEASYLARIQEVVDGHEALGSPFFFEYKDVPPLSPPTGEWLYALPSLVFGIAPATTLMVSKFILPAALFLLVYLLVLRLTALNVTPLYPPSKEGGRKEGALGLAELNAIACGLLVVLGYDLVDYRTVLSYLEGASSPGSFLLWARPVNPILGGIFLFSFLLFVWEIVRNTRQHTSAVIGAAVFLAFMFASYFFSWGTALSVTAALILLFLFRKEYKTAGTLAAIVPLGALLASPYWMAVWHALQSPWYTASVLRSGLFLTHYPLLNKFLLATLLFFVLALVVDFFLKRKEQGLTFFPIQGRTLGSEIEVWHLFCLALLLGGLWAYSQQVLTGRTIWPYHFVQYTIPFGMIVGMVVLYNVVRDKSRYIWGVVTVCAAVASIYFGVYTQATVYASSRPYYANLQDYAPLFSRLNEQERDCVVFVSETNPEMSELNTLIPAFTHCNRYASTELYALIPEERGVHGYLALLRLRGVSGSEIDEYLTAHRSEAAGYLYSNWKGLFGVKDFPDFSDPLLPERLDAFPKMYREFLAKDFKTELLQYRLDYILSSGPLDANILAELPTLGKVFEQNGLTLYAF